ncbi:endonuclease/exonuclease/phosphatase family protein [Cooperia oncophora]
MEASKRLRFDVIALQETKAKETATRKTNDGHLIVLGAKLSGRNVGGVGFLVHHRLEHMVDSVEVIGPRLAILRLRIDKRTFVSIINCYAPTSATDEEKDAFYKELEEMIKRERSYYKYVVGDFNAVIHEEMPATAHWATRNRRNKRERRTFDGPLRAMQSLSRKQLLHEKRGSATWESPNATTHSEIDHVLTNRKWSLLDVSVVDAFRTGSDHRLVRAKFVSERESEDATSSDLLPYGCHITTQTPWRRPPLTTRGRRRKTCRKTIPCS